MNALTQRPLTFLGGLFALLIVLIVVVRPGSGPQIPLTVYSAEASGGKALRLWLEALGYRVSTIEGKRFAIPSDVGTLLLLAPSEPLQDNDVATLDRWVRGGGRLVVADDGGNTASLLQRFDVSRRRADPGDLAVPTPNRQLDPKISAMPTDASSVLNLSGASDAEPLLVVVEHPGEGAPSPRARQVLAARVPVGRGEVLVLAAPDLLDNRALHSESNARLALSLVGTNTTSGVAFDEFHHGFTSARSSSLYDLLFEQAWGETLLLAAGVVLLFLLLRGRRFGRAVPIFVDRGRSLGELVTSQAALYRAGGKRTFVAEHLARQLRQEYAQEVGLPATATDEAIAARAQALGRDAGPALGVLSRIQRARSDRDLLMLAREGASARAGLARTGTRTLTPTLSQRERELSAGGQV